MSYQTYTTEAVVCGTWEKNTADKSYLLFTRAAGMLYADARSVREEKSKQRYALQDFSQVRVSLVRGKHNWRIGSIEAVKNHYRSAETKLTRGAVVDLYRFLRRFYKGEEPSPELFDYFSGQLETLNEDDALVERTMITKLHILNLLGYVDSARIPEEVRDRSQAVPVKLSDESIKKINLLIDTATTSSQL